MGGSERNRSSLWRRARVLLFQMAAAAIVLAGLYLQQRFGPDARLQKQIAHSVQGITPATLALDPGIVSLEILPLQHSVGHADIRQMMNHAARQNAAMVWHYQIGQGKVQYTMSAPDIDSQHHLANAYLEGYVPFAADNIALPLYALAQRKRYTLDETLYPGRPEIWQSSRQAFYYPRGDCEDHALVLADWLIGMGEDARVVVGDMAGEGHAWVVLLKDGKAYLLEATQKSGLRRNQPYPLAALHRNYHPQYMFNRDYFWVNTGSRHTTDYSDSRWEKRSRYHGQRGATDEAL